jgi:ribosomal-protein-alanine N-acetyltransferase
MLRWLFPHRSTPAVRRAGPADSAALAVLHADGGFSQAWSVLEFEELLSDISVETEVVCDSKKPSVVFGFSMSRLAADEAEILTIVISRRRRGEGLGRRLLESQIARLATRGVTTLYLEVEDGNIAARRLYERAHFVVVGERQGYYPKPDGRAATALIMKHHLS